MLHTPVNSNWTISPEFQYAENLIMCAILMKPIVLVFTAVAINIGCIKDPFAEVEIYCYKIFALVLCVSSIFTFVSVTCNNFVDHYGQTTFTFPPDIPVKKKVLISKHYIAVFPLGVVTIIVALFGVIFFLSEISSLKLQSQVKCQNTDTVTDKEVWNEGSCIFNICQRGLWIKIPLFTQNSCNNQPFLNKGSTWFSGSVFIISSFICIMCFSL